MKRTICDRGFLRRKRLSEWVESALFTSIGSTLFVLIYKKKNKRNEELLVFHSGEILTHTRVVPSREAPFNKLTNCQSANVTSPRRNHIWSHVYVINKKAVRERHVEKITLTLIRRKSCTSTCVLTRNHCEDE